MIVSGFIASLQCQVKNLQHQIDALLSGEKYQQLRKDYETIIAGKDKEINRLKAELAAAHAQTIDVREKWFQTCDDIQTESEKTHGRDLKRIQNLENEKFKILLEYDHKLEELHSEYSKALAEKDAVIDELKKEVARLSAQLNIDGTNSGTPTSQTPYSKDKVIPNTRKKSGKKKGGQPGHEQHRMPIPADDQIDETIMHEVGENECCPECGSSDLVFTGETDVRYEMEVVTKVVRRKHIYYVYQCSGCGTLVTTEIDPNLRTEAQYGPNVQAIALSLSNIVNSPFNKTRTFFSGITDGELSPSEGYIAKLQKRASKNLMEFKNDLRMALLQEGILYWDDTVVFIDKSRACYRFYGNDRIAYYTVHLHKDLEGLIDDKILEFLSPDTLVMHDHNTVNYNERFCFKNIECNQHLQRDCEKSAQDTHSPTLRKLKEFIGKTMDDRKAAVQRNMERFDEEYLRNFKKTVLRFLADAEKENTHRKDEYGGSFERALISRIQKYFDNYFSWVWDFSLPTTNNLSERSLRGVKSHMKVSGQFSSETTGQYHADIRTYIETCKRNRINEIEALKRLASGRPYTVAEVLGIGSSD